MQMILFFLQGSKRYYIAGAVFAALVALFDMLPPKLISFAVDYVIGDSEEPLGALQAKLVEMAGGMAYLREHFILLALAAVIIGGCGAVSRYLFRTLNARGSETFVERIRNTVFEHIMHLPYAWHSENKTGDIIQRCTSDVQTVKQFVSEHLVALVRIGLLIGLAIYFMAGLSPQVTIAAAIFIPITVLYSLIFHSKIGATFLKADEEEGKLSTIVQENLTGVRVVRAFGQEIYERRRFEKQNVFYTGFWVKLMKLMALFFSLGNIVSGLQNITVMSMGAVLCVNGTISTGSYIALVAYNAMMIWPIRQLGRVISQLSKAGISIERLRYIMNSEPEKDRENAVRPPMDRDISFRTVSFAYDNGTAEVLHDVSFDIPAGKTVGILGGTGSGKSTLIYLLERLYGLPEGSGSITIGDVDIADIDSDYLRDNIGVVLQEPYLFSRSLSENIAITKDNLNMAEIRAAAKAASIDDAITSFTQGYDTFVGERGVTLSGGQKQRTAIAQMLIRKPPVMVFDDSLSAVDAETDQKIRHAIRENTGKSTMIIIAHRITTIMNADNIIVLDKGRVAQSGTHAQLMEQEGLYRKIFELQSKGMEV
ncbi:MAG: ABC transporter ATP-binding protein/permease [Lachnospiraceae bacterium]|nr:ABC transporter ATP-binding protein/permease [Lachnospiraceae bacterium]